MEEMHEETTEHSERDRMSALLPRSLEDVLDVALPSPGSAQALQAGSANLDMESMQVVVRIRPTGSKLPNAQAPQTCVHAVSSKSLAIAAPERENQGIQNGRQDNRQGKTFMFSAVFNAGTAQTDFFDATAKPMVMSILSRERRGCAMMAYGTSSAGKTHTMEGTRMEPGVIPQALHLILQETRQKKECRSVYVSRYEVYNERIFDLLNDGPVPLEGRRHLEVKETVRGTVFIEGLHQVVVETLDQGLELLRRSSKHRRKAATSLNYSSSRSHSVFSVTVGWREGADGQPDETTISFIDLAGSERVKDTGNTGERLGESKAINSSLMTLRYCLENLRWNQRHKSIKPRQLPYRESKITHIFRDLLHGWGSIVFCVNVSPMVSDFDGTIKVLQYATMAAQIGMAARHAAPKREYKAKSPNIRKRMRTEDPDSKLDQAQQEALEDQKLALHRQMETIRGLSSKVEDLEDTKLEQRQELSMLNAELAKEREMRAMAESDIRESVAAEMEELLRDMQASYKERLAAESAQLEKRLMRMAEPNTATLPQEDSMATGQHPSCEHCAGLEEGLEALGEQCQDLQARLHAAECREAELGNDLSVRNEQLEDLESALEQSQQQQGRLSERLEQYKLEMTTLTNLHKEELLARQAEAANLESELKAALQTQQESQNQLRAATEREQDTQQQLVLAKQECEAMQQSLQLQTDEYNSRLQAIEVTTSQSSEDWEKKSRQAKANTDAEREMLECQLERASKEKAALLQRLHLALNCTPKGGLGSRGLPAAPTPHFVALARAQGQVEAHQQEPAVKARAGQTRLKPTQDTLPCNSPAFSPAIQWTATPDACQVVCGKLPPPPAGGLDRQKPSQEPHRPDPIPMEEQADEGGGGKQDDTATENTGQMADSGMDGQESTSACPSTNNAGGAACKPEDPEAQIAAERAEVDSGVLKPNNCSKRAARGKRVVSKQKQAPVSQAELPMTRRRRLLAPTPLKVRLALGQEEGDEENIDPMVSAASDAAQKVRTIGRNLPIINEN